jgi:hypothetical protein
MMLLSFRSEFDASFSCCWVSRSLGRSDGLCRRLSSFVTFAGSKCSLGRSVAVYVVECVLAWFLAEFGFCLCVA